MDVNCQIAQERARKATEIPYQSQINAHKPKSNKLTSVFRGLGKALRKKLSKKKNVQSGPEKESDSAFEE